jgi:hypothetical protein
VSDLEAAAGLLRVRDQTNALYFPSKLFQSERKTLCCPRDPVKAIR